MIQLILNFKCLKLKIICKNDDRVELLTVIISHPIHISKQHTVTYNIYNYDLSITNNINKIILIKIKVIQ